MTISRERLDATAIYNAEWITVGNHQQLDLKPEGDALEKPQYATHLKIQTLDQNIRYSISDAVPATPTLGFQLAAGSDVTLPCPENRITVAEEAAGAIIEYQWLR